MAKPSKKFKVIPNPELQRVGRAFRPEFGSDEDLGIIQRLQALEALLPKVDNEILRGDSKNWTKKMRDILFTENALIHHITKRNNDF